MGADLLNRCQRATSQTGFVMLFRGEVCCALVGWVDNLAQDLEPSWLLQQDIAGPDDTTDPR